MGSVLSSLFRSLSNLFGKRLCRILILGLDNAGKTTILYRLHLGEVTQTIPTIGFNIETVEFDNLRLQVWDLGGQTSIRPYWRYYYHNTNAIIYVIDSADADRLEDSKTELTMMLQEEELKNAIVAIFANKQDLPGVMTPVEISQRMNLTDIKTHQWAIFQTSALKGSGISESLSWLVEALQNQ